MEIDLHYRQTIELPDGNILLLRAIRPDDKQALAEAFERLSLESRRSRFFSAKRSLSEEDLRFFTEIDGITHFAVVAVVFTDEGEEGVGVARFVKTQRADTVEIALVVADGWQQRGIGSRMLHVLVAAAVERGYRYIRAVTQSDNDRLKKLLEPYQGRVRMLEGTGGLVEILIELPPRIENREDLGIFDALIRMVAVGSLVVPVQVGRAAVDLARYWWPRREAARSSDGDRPKKPR